MLRPLLLRRLGRTALMLVASAVLAGCAVAAGFAVTGGTWFVVETPSMGRTAPVGSLLIDVPVEQQRPRVGDIVSFRPSRSVASVYTHRVVAVGSEGITTRGDINGAVDAWRLQQDQLVGRVVAVLPGAGWLLRALPVLVAGGLVVIALTSVVAPGPVRTGSRMLGFALVAAAEIAWLRPFVNATMLTTARTPAGDLTATVVSTGLLPIRVVAPGGATADLVAGQVGALLVPRAALGVGRFEMRTEPNLPPELWLVLAAACLAPLAWSAVTAWRSASQGVQAAAA